MTQVIKNPAYAVVVTALILPVAVGVSAAILMLPESEAGLRPAVEAQIPQAGATNPVTAVLLNFRAYDTMLEIAVLLMALLGARALATGNATQLMRPQPMTTILIGFVRIVAPLLVLAAGYLLWVGGHAPGGAFQGGAVLASLGVLLVLCGIPTPRWYFGVTERVVIVAGLAAFLVVGLAVMIPDEPFLAYPVAHAKTLILAIEAACTISIGAILFGLFAAGQDDGSGVES